MDYQSFQPGGQEQNQTPIQTPVTPPPMELMPRKTITPKLIGVIVLLLVLGSGVYAGIWWWGNQQTAQEVMPTFTPRPTPDTSTWKTYANTRYGFEFKYPDTVKAVDNVQLPEVAYLQSVEYSGKEAEPANFKQGIYARIEVLPNTKSLSLASFVKEYLKSYVTTQTQVIINGQDAIMVKYSNTYSNSESEGPYSMATYYFLKGPNVYGVDARTNYKPATSEHINIINQILSTFKFTK